jgi:hypothetical protein
MFIVNGIFMEKKQRFKQLVDEYYLEYINSATCPGCDGILSTYQSKYINSVTVRFCNNSYELEDDVDFPNTDVNICPYCKEIVAFEDKDAKNYIQCNSCECKAHRKCVEDIICTKCDKWECDMHSGNLVECDQCGRFHEDDDIVSFSSDFIDEFGTICNQCFYRYDDLYDEVKRPLKGKYKDIVLNLSKDSHFYISEARENFDLTIMLSHLIKGDNPFEILTKILNDKVIYASETGYYHKSLNTKSVCFADLTIRGLLRHSQKYSSFGLAFLKQIVYENGGAPALYIREDILSEKISLPDTIKPFVNKLNLDNYDFHHEREWRIPNDFYFEHNEISVLYAPTRYHSEIREKYPNIKILIDLDFISLI